MGAQRGVYVPGVDLAPSDIREVATKRVLAKKNPAAIPIASGSTTRK
jgi:hypothetical protein